MNQRKRKKSLVAVKDKAKLVRGKSLSESLVPEQQCDCVGGWDDPQATWLQSVTALMINWAPQAGRRGAAAAAATLWSRRLLIMHMTTSIGRSASPQEFTTGASAANATGIESTGGSRSRTASQDFSTRGVKLWEPPYSYILARKATQNHDYTARVPLILQMSDRIVLWPHSFFMNILYFIHFLLAVKNFTVEICIYSCIFWFEIDIACV